MNIFYLIQAHTNPAQLKRMIDRLAHHQVHFIIHIDKKSDIEPFKAICTQQRVVFITDRVNCIWGDFSQVQATLNLIEYLPHAQAQPQDRIVLISGQDYPLRTAEQIHSFYQNHATTEFIEMFIAKDVHPRPYLNFRGYKVNKSDKRGDYVIFKKNNISGIHKSIIKGCFKFKYLQHIFKQRELDASVEFYKGSSWWALTYETIQQIITFYKEDYERLHSFFSVSFCADEYFFQTIVAELMKKGFHHPIEPVLTYIDWDRKNVPLPVTFTSIDQEVLKQASKATFLYARKFDAAKDATILDWIDIELLQ